MMRAGRVSILWIVVAVGFAIGFPKEAKSQIAVPQALDIATVRQTGQEIVRKHTEWVGALERWDAAARGAGTQNCPDCLENLEAEADSKLVEAFDYLVRIVERSGWVSSEVWEEGVEGAGLDIVASRMAQPDERSIRFAKLILPELSEAVATRGANANAYAFIVDTLELFEDRPQLYGSVFDCVDGKFVPRSVLEPAKLNERRASIGLGSIESHRYSQNIGMQEFCSRPTSSPG
jgi:hypothetical protein